MRTSNFMKDIIHGPNFVCFSCNKILFIKQVKILKNLTLRNLFSKVDDSFLKNDVGIDLKSESIIFCHHCITKINARQLPSIHTSNGLELENIPDELKLKPLELQCISLDLFFMKIKKLPTSRMHANFDRVICVPIDATTVSKTISDLPRHPDDANIVAVQLKRKLEMKTSHLQEYIRPKFIVNAVKMLKKLHNPFYQDIVVNEDFLIKDSRSDDKDDSDEIENGSELQKNDSLQERGSQLLDNCPSEVEIIDEGNKMELKKDQENEEKDDNTLEEDDMGKILPNVKEYQSQCLKTQKEDKKIADG